jgi:TolB-like protein
LPRTETEPRYQPLPGSLAVLPFVPAADTASAQTAAESLYFSVMEGLEQAAGLTLIRLRPSEQSDDPQAFAESLGVAALASGRMVQSEAGMTVEVTFRDVTVGEVTWADDFPWEPTRGIEAANGIANGLLQAMGLSKLDERQFARWPPRSRTIKPPSTWTPVSFRPTSGSRRAFTIWPTWREPKGTNARRWKDGRAGP